MKHGPVGDRAGKIRRKPAARGELEGDAFDPAGIVEADVVFEDGRFTVAGTDKSLGLGDVSLAAYVPHNYPEGLEPGLEETAFYDPKNFTFPAGAHVAEVEIDPDTGVVDLVAVSCADDVGRIINPMIVDGQMHGGLAHGIGQALLECCKYDESGQLLTGS